MAALLKREDQSAWVYILGEIVRREKCVRKTREICRKLGLEISDFTGQLYLDMIRNKRLDLFRGESKTGEELDANGLINWMRFYFKGYIQKELRDRDKSNEISLDEPLSDENDDGPKSLSDIVVGDTSAYEDRQILMNDDWRTAFQCFAELWRRNGLQAHVLLLKARFLMSSQEIKERLGISSTDNVDQLFSRALKTMKELKVKYGN